MVQFKLLVWENLLSTDRKFCAYRSVFLFLAVIVMISCSKENDAGQRPSFELVADSNLISGNSLTVPPGSLMKFKVHASQGSNKLTNFFIEITDAEKNHHRIYDTAFYLAEFDWEGSFYKSSEIFETWLFCIRDRQGLGNGDVINIYADSNSQYNPVQALVNIEMGAQNNMQFGDFYSFESQTVYFIQQAKENQELMDLVFYFGEDDLTMASPGANIEDGIFPENDTPVNWSIRNTTRFIKTSISESEFSSVNNDSIMIANYSDADGKRKAKNLTAGDVYVFKNQSNRLGLFRVDSVSGTTEGFIKFEVKIQNQGE